MSEMTMTPEQRDELMIEIGLHYVLRSPPSVTTDAIAPIIERLVAERVAGETERCAGIADAHKADWARKHDAAKAVSHSAEARDFQTMMIAAVTIDLAIRSATR